MAIPDDTSTTADADVLGTAQRHLSDIAGRFEVGGIPLREADADLREGAGQVAHLLADAQDLFLTSWSSVFDLCAEAGGLVAGNIGALVTDLAAVDIAGGRGYRL
jgi:hypothetical protein